MLKRYIITALMLAIFTPQVFAQDVGTTDVQLRHKVKELDAENDQQDAKLAEFEEKMKELDETILHREKGLQDIRFSGVKMAVGGTFILQGTPNANAVAAADKSAVAPSFSADVTLEREFVEFKGDVFLHVEAGSGNGLENVLSVYSNVNQDANNNIMVQLTELWYKQYFWDERFGIVFGLVDDTVSFDDNRAANDETTQFLARIFRNDPAIEFTVNNNLGLRAAIRPVDLIEIQYGLVNAATDWNDLGNHLFNIGELTFKPRFGGFVGNYRLIAWRNGMTHTKWSTGATGLSSFGFATSVDQNVSKNIILFARYGWQRPGVYNPLITNSNGLNYSINQSWSGGISLDGEMWGRNDDNLAAAVGQVIPSSDYRDATGRKANNELHAEAYYRIKFNRHLAISPDMEFVWQPFGGAAPLDEDYIFIGGARAQIDF